MIKLLLFFFIPLISICCPVVLHAQHPYPEEINQVLSQTKTNKIELENAINYYLEKGDPYKIKAIYFLIRNMDIHFSDNYYWADSAGIKINFDEQNYADFSSSIKAFDSLKQIYKKIHPIAFRYRDIDTIKAHFLISNIEKAFKFWQIPESNVEEAFTIFCENILPYRISVEPLQDWRSIYAEKFSFLVDSSIKIPVDTTLKNLIVNINKWFTCTYKVEKRKEPLPRLGSLQLLLRKKGLCEDIAGLSVFSLRSIGIPATVDYVPYWATSTGNHTLNAAYNEKHGSVPFDVLLKSSKLNHFIREPAKVFRTTYSKQKKTLAAILPLDSIPPGPLQKINYLDVTSEYWKTRDVSCQLNNKLKEQTIVYSCVLNGLKWQAAWWGRSEGNIVVFENMCQGAVFLPMCYSNGTFRAAGPPVASGYDTTLILSPDLNKTHSIKIKQLDNFLIIRPGAKYKLYYWSDSWKILAEKTADKTTTEFDFDLVPKNALLLFVPDYSQKKERPFTVSDEGVRTWW